MEKLIKIIFRLVVVVVLVIIFVAIALLLYIDINDFKPEIESAVNDATGRKLVIEGDLELSVFPWLGVSSGKVVLGNPSEFTTTKFAEIASSEIKVKLLPLFLKKLEFKRIIIKGLRLNLVKNKEGDNNWEDLIGQNKNSIKSIQTLKQDNLLKYNKNYIPLFTVMAIGGIDLENAFIIWNDQQKDRHFELQKLNFQTQSLKFNQPISIDLVATFISTKPAITEQLKLSTAVVLNDDLHIFAFKNLKINSLVKKDVLLGEKINSSVSASIDVNLLKQTAKIPNFKLTINDLNLFADLSIKNSKKHLMLNGSIKVDQFNLRQWLQQLGIELPDMQDTSAFNAVSLQSNVASKDDFIAFNQLQIKVDASTASGNINIKNSNPQIVAFKIDLDLLNVDNYLLAKTFLKNTPKAKKIVTTRIITPSSVTIASILPIKTLQKFNVDGELKIGKLLINRLNMQDVAVNLKVNKGKIVSIQRAKQFYQGHYLGNISIDVNGKMPIFSVEKNISNAQIGALLKDLNGDDNLTGITNISIKLSGGGNNIKTIKSSLHGVMQASITEGYVKGFNVKKILANGKSILKGQPFPVSNKNDKSEFSMLTASAKVDNGVIKNDDLFIKSSALRVHGKGTVNLITETLDYNLLAKLLKWQAKKNKSEKIYGIPVAINVSGTFSKPTYSVDLTAMLFEKNKANIVKKKQKLLDKLNEKLDKEVEDLFKKLF